MLVRTLLRASCVIALALAVNTTVAAQAGVALSGRLLNSLSGDPIAGATVQIDDLRRTTTSGSDGMFSFDNVPPGTYHVSVRSSGYSTRRTEVVVGTSAAVVDVTVAPELHFSDITTVTGDARSQFDVFQPTAVLAGQELTKQLEMSLGATLEGQPGVANRSFGPGPARPVIRGLDGDRVVILQDGQRMSDLSSQSSDHGVTFNPAAAQRIEVVRGPATLLYGSSAIGGLVNIITEDIQTAPVQGATGSFTADVGTAAKEAGAAANVRVGNGAFALNAGGGGRTSDDVDTPEGELLNSHSRNGFGTVGVSWTGQRRYFGGSYGYDDTKYGAPMVEEGQVKLTPRKHAFSVRGGGGGLQGAFDAYRATLAVRRYKHEEIVAGEVGTAFTNDTEEVEVMGSHRLVGRLKGSIGGWFFNRGYEAAGEEALTPPIDQRAFAAFVYEEITWPHVMLQLGGRIDRADYEPADEETREFTTGSGSVGLLFTPAAAREQFTVAVSLARTARYPALDELFNFGPHPGNFSFEIGNPDLDPEHALGFDLSARFLGPRAAGEITYFRNDIRNFVFRRPVSEAEFVRRLRDWQTRFPERDIEPGPPQEEFPIVENVGADSVLQGVEAHGDFGLTSQLFAEVTLDYVRGEVKDSGDPLPRIPPLRFRGGLRYQYSAFQVGGDVTATAKQDRVFDEETPTDGSGLLRLFASYSFQPGPAVHTITARLDNVTDELYRNHLSLIKDLAPEMGRNFRVVYNVRF